jgi:hypothetical protein
LELMRIEPDLMPKLSRRRAERPQTLSAWPRNDRYRRMLALLVMLLAWETRAAAQVTSPMGTQGAATVGSSGGLRPPSQPPLLSGTPSAGVKTHLSPTGKPCLTVLGSAKPQIINPNIFEHIILASNECSQSIKVKVCYYQSTQCVPLDVPAYGRKEIVLGIMPAMNQFRFEYREQFNSGMGGLGAAFN